MNLPSSLSDFRHALGNSWLSAVHWEKLQGGFSTHLCVHLCPDIVKAGGQHVLFSFISLVAGCNALGLLSTNGYSDNIQRLPFEWQK